MNTLWETFQVIVKKPRFNPSSDLVCTSAETWINIIKNIDLKNSNSAGSNFSGNRTYPIHFLDEETEAWVEVGGLWFACISSFGQKPHSLIRQQKGCNLGENEATTTDKEIFADLIQMLWVYLVYIPMWLLIQMFWAIPVFSSILKTNLKHICWFLV